MLSAIAKLLLRASGWTAVGGIPDVPKAVIIAAPHTSNWDAVWAMLYKVAIGLEVRWYAKHTLFWFPLGALLRWLGGMPLNRSQPGTAIERAIKMFEDTHSFYFGIAPEGTRSYKPHWKTGFYRIALAAEVPVVCGYLDYSNKHVGLGPAIEMTGNRETDAAKFREFYTQYTARMPEKTSPVIFPPEEH